MGEDRARTASTTRPRGPGPERLVGHAEAAHLTPARDAFREGSDEMVTREMDPEQFRALLAQESGRARTPTIPATNEVMKDLVACSAAHPDDDLAIPVEPREPEALVEDDHPPHEPLDLPELDPRRAVRQAIAPRLPTAPASSNRLTLLLVILVLAAGGTVAYYAITGRL